MNQMNGHTINLGSQMNQINGNITTFCKEMKENINENINCLVNSMSGGFNNLTIEIQFFIRTLSLDFLMILILN